MPNEDGDTSASCTYYSFLLFTNCLQLCSAAFSYPSSLLTIGRDASELLLFKCFMDSYHTCLRCSNSYCLRKMIPFSGFHCTKQCLSSADCMACNWKESTGTCELVDSHSTPDSAQGYTVYTSKYNACYQRTLWHVTGRRVQGHVNWSILTQSLLIPRVTTVYTSKYNACHQRTVWLVTGRRAQGHVNWWILTQLLLLPREVGLLYAHAKRSIVYQLTHF